MRKAKKEVPMVIIDTRNKGLQPLQDQRLVEQTPIKDQDIVPLLLVLLHRFAMNIYGSFSGLKNRFYYSLKDYLFQKRIPWIQVGLVTLTAFVLIKKDLQFNFALKAPVGLFVDDSDETTTNKTRQAVTL